jgi:hypothetical protein
MKSTQKRGTTHVDLCATLKMPKACGEMILHKTPFAMYVLFHVDRMHVGVVFPCSLFYEDVSEILHREADKRISSQRISAT